jgi:hypothetical protein
MKQFKPSEYRVVPALVPAETPAEVAA